jgi:hypothetical protein
MFRGIADGNNEACTISVTTATRLSVSEFDTETNYDFITTSVTGTTRFSGNTAATIAGINAIDVDVGDTITWCVPPLYTHTQLLKFQSPHHHQP